MLIDSFLTVHRTPKLSAAEQHMLEQAAARTMEVAAKHVIVREGVPLSQCTLLLKGMVYRFKDTDEGQRQILAIHIPGDFVDLHSYPLKHLEHSVATVTPASLAIFPHAAIQRLTAESTVITELLWRSTLIDAAMNREWLLSVGRRSAIARLAHLFCEMFKRLERIGAVQGGTFPFPLTQTELGEATGLTAVHTNRMMAALRKRGLLELRNGVAEIRDWEGLCTLADFQPGYLFLD